MDKFSIAMRLMKSFPNSFVNGNGEFVAHRDANEYFILKNCETEEDVKFKVLAWLTRAACKSEPFRTKRENDQFQSFMRRGINNFLNTEFTLADMYDIYTFFGYGCNKQACMEFIRSGFDMQIVLRIKEGR